MYAPVSNIMFHELAFIVAVQYCILHHQLKYVEGTSPDSIASTSLHDSSKFIETF